MSEILAMTSSIWLSSQISDAGSVKLKTDLKNMFPFPNGCKESN